MAGSLDRDLNVNVTADASKFERGMKSAAASARVMERELKKQEAAAERFRENTGRAMVGVGAGILVGAGLAVKAAVEWESAWAGVEKTVDGSAQEMAALEGQLRSMARELPASHKEIAAVAEAAGQLGIERENIAEFTKVMIDMGETTNLTAEVAATQMARFGNVMGTAQSDVDRLGSSIVALGNSSATTEAEILEMGMRLSGAGKQIGLTEGEVLGFSAALSSVGIRAEAGGSSVSGAFVKIAEAVDSGSDKLDTLATVAGMTTNEFKRAFEQDAAGAIQAFIEGLGRVDEAGVSTFAVLDELGLGEIRVRDAMLRLSASGDLLADSLATGNEGWKANIALVDEAAKRYATTESQMKIARNNVNDLGITIGETLLPVVGAAAEKLSALVRTMADAPPEVQRAVTIFGTAAGVISLIGGGALIAVPKVHRLRETLVAMGGTAAKVNTGLGKVGSFLAGPWGVAIGAATAAMAIFAMTSRDAEASQRELADALSSSGGEFDASTRSIVLGFEEYQEVANSIDAVGISHGQFIDALVKGGPAMDRMRQQLDDIQKAGTQYGSSGIVIGMTDTARAAGEVRNQMDPLRGIIVNSIGDWERNKDAMSGATDEMAEIPAVIEEEVDPAMQALGESFGEAADEAAKAAQEMLDAWAEATASFVDSGEAYQAVLSRKEESERETAQKTADATKKASDSWEDYVSDVQVSAEEYIAELQKQVKAQRDWKKNMVGLAARVPAEMLDHYARLGPEGAAEVQLLHDMTDKQLQRVVKAFKARSDESVSGFARNLADAQQVLAAIALEMGLKTAKRVAEGMRKNGGDVYKAAEDQGILIDRGIRTDELRVVYADVNAARGIREAHRFAQEVNEALSSIPNEQIQLKIQADFVAAKQALNRASGGILPGPPSDTDNMVINAASGEFVVNARSTRKHRPLIEAINADRLPGFARGGEVVTSNINARGEGMQGARRDILSAARDHYADDPLALIAAGGVGGGSVGAGVERWRSIALQALAYTGSPLSWIDSLLRRMNQESGGNPMAINLWDSNAKAGIPSQGLMQTIPPTFYAYARELAHLGIYNPFANIVASIRYANSRYGAAPIGWDQPGGYDSGGILPSGKTGINKSGKPERILSPRQTKAFERLVDTLQGAPSGDTSGRQLARAIEDLVVILRQSGKPGLASRLGGPFEARMTRMFQRRERLDERIERAANRRDRATGRRSDLVSGVRGNILAERDLTSFSVNGPRDVREILEENLRRVRRFQRRLRRLTRMGFRKEIVAQIAQAGPEAGAAMAQALSKAGPKQVAGINKQFRDIGLVSKRFSREMGNELFSAGVQMSRGLLRGLRKNRRALRREMRMLGRSMVKDIRSELKISSPSKEMDWTGEMAAKGLLGGWGRELSGSWFDTKGITLKQTIPQVAPMRAQDRSVRVAIDYDRLGESVARAMNRSGSRQLKVSGRMSIDAGRNGGLVGVMRDVAAEEARDEADWRRG